MWKEWFEDWFYQLGVSRRGRLVYFVGLFIALDIVLIVVLVALALRR